MNIEPDIQLEDSSMLSLKQHACHTYNSFDSNMFHADSDFEVLLSAVNDHNSRFKFIFDTEENKVRVFYSEVNSEYEEIPEFLFPKEVREIKSLEVLNSFLKHSYLIKHSFPDSLTSFEVIGALPGGSGKDSSASARAGAGAGGGGGGGSSVVSEDNFDGDASADTSVSDLEEDWMPGLEEVARSETLTPPPIEGAGEHKGEDEEDNDNFGFKREEQKINEFLSEDDMNDLMKYHKHLVDAYKDLIRGKLQTMKDTLTTEQNYLLRKTLNSLKKIKLSDAIFIRKYVLPKEPYTEDGSVVEEKQREIYRICINDYALSELSGCVVFDYAHPIESLIHLLLQKIIDKSAHLKVFLLDIFATGDDGKGIKYIKAKINGLPETHTVCYVQNGPSTKLIDPNQKTYSSRVAAWASSHEELEYLKSNLDNYTNDSTCIILKDRKKLLYRDCIDIALKLSVLQVDDLDMTIETMHKKMLIDIQKKKYFGYFKDVHSSVDGVRKEASKAIRELFKYETSHSLKQPLYFEPDGTIVGWKATGSVFKSFLEKKGK